MSATKPDTPDCEPQHSGLLSVEQALQKIFQELKPIPGYEKVFLREALDRVLAEAVISPLNVPAYANSAMDGYAIRAADLDGRAESELTVIGTAMAGIPYPGEVEQGQAVRIMTGAKLPDGADTVIMQEQVRRHGERVRIEGGHKHGQNVRHPGEDLAVGQTVLQPGRRLRPADLGLVASLGIPEVVVRRRLRVAFFSTGDELCSIGQPLGDGQIYDSNRYTLFGMLSRLGADVIDMGVVPDRREAIEAAFNDAAGVADVLLTSGGVSVGEADFVKETLEKLGQVNFWKIAMKPGKPLAFGRLGECVFFGLPGNPVSVMATFYQVVQPALRYLYGEHVTAPQRMLVPCADDLKKRPGRADFQRGILTLDSQGRTVVHSTGNQGSHVLSSMSQANCFIVLPAEAGNLPAGTLVEVEAFDGLT